VGDDAGDRGQRENRSSKFASPAIGTLIQKWKNINYSSEELTAARRQRGEAAFPSTTERVLGASSVGSPVVAYFDWEIPELTTPHLITFLARIRSQTGERSFRIPIDIARLAAEGRTSDLERLHNVLSLRHAGIDTPSARLEAIEWLLDISLEQTEAELSPDKRRSKIQELLSAVP
jgi:hypothetical protein